ncbi:MAG TPA: hypothetical protein VG692_13030 [Gemmatimonadales bacterium]|nr:hypothetical protein [Gemmatimonadales bacterium]
MTRIRSIVPLLLVGVLASCAEPTSSTGAPGFASVAVRAVAPPSLSRFAPALVVEQVSVLIGTSFNDGQSFDTVASRTVPFGDNTNQLDLSLSLPVSGVDTLELQVEYRTATGTVLFTAGSQVIVAPNRTTSPPPLVPFYSGPGSNVAFMSMNGDDTTATAGSDVQFDVSAFDGQGLPVPEFYLTWSTSDPRVTVSPRGLVHTVPHKTMRVFVTAVTPTGVQASTLMDVLGDDAFAITPDSVELRPGGTQQFFTDFGPDVSIAWTVNGVVDGDSVHGYIDDGFYAAPSTPLPGDETQVCVINPDNPAQKGCAKVRVPAVPSVGADIVVINDQNIFDTIPMKRSGNQRFVRNLVNFTASGPRSSGRTVWFDRGRDSPCMLDTGFGQECGDGEKSRFIRVIQNEGFRIVKFDSYTPIQSIPLDVKVIVMWMPLIQYDFSEVAQLKRFASEGGRIIFIGERPSFYTDLNGEIDGIQIENAFLRSMGSGMTNLGDDIDCIANVGDPYPVSGPNSLRTHPLTAGVSNLSYACASQIVVGPDDVPFFYDISNTKVLGAVAKIDLSAPITAGPRPTAQGLTRPQAGTGSRRSGAVR